jgi:hypothetical protein
MSSQRCLGTMCPASLEMINTPNFVRRAGIIPYVAPTSTSNGRMLVGIKEGRYTDFGGGCRIGKKELPFDCAIREMGEEVGEEYTPSLSDITHIFVSGKKHPHQVVLMIRVDRLMVPKKIPEGELERVDIMPFPTFQRLDKRKLQDSLRSIYNDMVDVMMRL